MKKAILLFALLFAVFTKTNAQNLFFIGDKSYPCTETFTMESNAESSTSNLDVLFAKDGTTGIIAVSTTSMTGVLIKGKLSIYLDDGTVISCVDRGKYDLVDNKATTVFFLTIDELKKMENSNLNTIRYTLKCGSGCTFSTEEGNFSASNKAGYINYSKRSRIDVPSLITELFTD